jgi:hypothetical protein
MSEKLQFIEKAGLPGANISALCRGNRPGTDVLT